MISIREQDYGLDIALYNEFSLADFKGLENALLKRQNELKKTNLLLDLSELIDFTIDMAIEEIKFMHTHHDKINKVAIITTDVWIRLSTQLAKLLAHTQTQYFDNADDARAWLEA